MLLKHINDHNVTTLDRLLGSDRLEELCLPFARLGSVLHTNRPRWHLEPHQRNPIPMQHHPRASRLALGVIDYHNLEAQRSGWHDELLQRIWTGLQMVLRVVR